MLGFVFLFCIAMMIVVAVIAIPADVRVLLWENCHGSRGQLRLKYLVREFNAVAEFYSSFLFVGAILAAIGLFVSIQVNEHLIPLGLAKQAVMDLGSNLENPEETLKKNVGRKHRQWVMGQGGTPEQASSLQRMLWVGFPIALCISFACLILVMRLFSERYDASLDELVRGGVKRDLRRVTSHYLKSTAQAKQRRWQHSMPEQVESETDSDSEVASSSDS